MVGKSDHPPRMPLVQELIFSHQASLRPRFRRGLPYRAIFCINPHPDRLLPLTLLVKDLEIGFLLMTIWSSLIRNPAD